VNYRSWVSCNNPAKKQKIRKLTHSSVFLDIRACSAANSNFGQNQKPSTEVKGNAILFQTMRSQPNKLLPPLAFGHRIAKSECSIAAMESKFSHAKGWETQYEPIGSHEKFVNQSVSLNINGLHVMAVAHTPMRTRVKAETTHSLFIPLSGKNNDYLVNGHRLTYGQGENAIFAPAGERFGQSGYRSVLIIDVNTARLQQTTAAMLGLDDPLCCEIDFGIPHSLKLRANDVALDEALMPLCGLIDQFCTSQNMLEKLAIDDSIYRIMAMMFQPDQLIEPDARVGKVADNRLNAVCEYARANLGKTITLTELEQQSKLSARTLQNAFQKAYGYTPMQWIREQRYQRVHQRLLTAGSDESVIEIALSYNFLSSSKFAAGYKQRFGELPSATLARARS
jgi:AraC-like DNA-binding protein